MDIIFYQVIGMNYYYNAPEGFYIHRQEKKSQIKKSGILMGSAFLLYIFLQNVLFIAFELAGLADLYYQNPVFQSAADTVLICISLPLPFFLLSKKMRRVSRVSEPLSLEKPESLAACALAVLAGVGICMFSNIVTSYITVFMEIFGIHPEAPDVEMPSGFTGVVITVVRVIICAALTEEIAIRGYVMGNLRAYGDRFAILMSSVLFAAMHGNLVQAPFALMAGFAIGYFTVKTGSMWTGIIIHAVNNGISVAITYASEQLSEVSANIIAAALIYGLMIVGILAFILFRMTVKDKHLSDDCTVLTLREKCSAFIFNPAMLAVIAYMVYITLLYVEIG